HGVVHALRQDADGWTLLDPDGREIVHADAVIVAAAMASAGLCTGLPLRPFRGQASFVRTLADPPAAMAWGGYLVPTREGVLFGATYDKDDMETDVRPGDHSRNLATLA